MFVKKSEVKMDWPDDVALLNEDQLTLLDNYAMGSATRLKARDLSPLRAGGGGDVSRFVCGSMGCDPHLSRPILTGLPPVFKKTKIRRAGTPRA